MRRTVIIGSTLLLALTFLSSVVRAQDGSEDEGRALFQSATAHYEAGRFRESAEEFQRAYDLSGRPGPLYNVFLAWRDAGEREAAIDALRMLLAHTGDMPSSVPGRPELEQALEVLAQELAASEQDGSLADGRTTSGVTTGATTATAPTGDEPTRAEERGARGTVPPVPEERRSEGDGWIVPWITVGAGAALLVAALVFNRLAADQASTLDANCPDDLCPADYDWQGVVDRFNLYRGTAWGLLGGGLVAAAAGLALYFLTSSDESNVTASAACDTTGCTTEVMVRFL